MVLPLSSLPSSCGIVLRACAEILRASPPIPVQQEVSGGKGVVRTSVGLAVQYVQIYQNNVSDLLSGDAVRVGTMEAAHLGSMQVHLQGAKEVAIHCLEDVLRVLQVGERRKRVAATACNEHSSRAHTLLLFSLTQVHSGRVLRSCLHLVDLAGCEKMKQSQVEGARRAETVGINSSLLVLSKVISALVERRQHVPYHESRLTLLLRAAFGGNSRTLVLLTASLNPNQAPATLQALRFGENCCMISNKTRIATSSIEEATTAIETVLSKCKKEMDYLESTGKSKMSYFEKLNEHYNQLLRKSRELSLLKELPNG